MNGFVCAKKTKMKDVLDNLATQKKLVARSDNCEGLGLVDEIKL